MRAAPGGRLTHTRADRVCRNAHLGYVLWMEGLTEIVVDQKVLDGFKRRALKVYPLELLEQVVGRIVGPQARVFAFQAIEHEATRRDITLDDDVNPMTEGEDVRRF